jgi:hypothetical protein
MSTNRNALDATGKDPITSDLEILLTRELAGRDTNPREAGQRHSALRLQPVVLPPPPGEEGTPAPWPDHAPSPEDDIDLDLDDDQTARRRQIMLAAAGLLIAIVGTVAFLVFGGGEQPMAARAPVPTIQTDPAALTKAPPPAPQQIAPEPTSITARAVGDQSMGAVSTELVPPSTDGLSPARRIATTRIIVENDKEVSVPRQ